MATVANTPIAMAIPATGAATAVSTTIDIIDDIESDMLSMTKRFLGGTNAIALMKPHAMKESHDDVDPKTISDQMPRLITRMIYKQHVVSLDTNQVLATVTGETNDAMMGQQTIKIELPDGRLLARAERTARESALPTAEWQITFTVGGHPFATFDPSKEQIERSDGAGGLKLTVIASRRKMYMLAGMLTLLFSWVPSVIVTKQIGPAAWGLFAALAAIGVALIILASKIGAMFRVTSSDGATEYPILVCDPPELSCDIGMYLMGGPMRDTGTKRCAFSAARAQALKDAQRFTMLLLMVASHAHREMTPLHEVVPIAAGGGAAG